MENRTVRRLTLITNPNARQNTELGPTTGVQHSLFPSGNSASVVFVCFPDVTEGEFVAALEQTNPAVVVELRKAPRFDVGKMNRNLAFEIFRRQGSLYIDLNIDNGHSDDQLLSRIREIIATYKQERRSIMFLVSAAPGKHSPLSDSVVQCFKGTDETWEIYQVPQHQKRSLRA